MKCSVHYCEERSLDRLAVIDDGVRRILLCPAHQVDYVAGGSNINKLAGYSSLEEHYICEICQGEAILFADQVELRLCRDHLVKLIKRSLSPKDYKALVGKHGIFNLIGEQWYVGGGYAVQPIRS